MFSHMEEANTERIACLKWFTSSGDIDELKQYFLQKDTEIIIGREVNCEIAIDAHRHPSISRYHAKLRSIERDGGIGWQVCDLNSANGTYINGERLQNCQVLEAGDRISLSKEGIELLFEYQQIDGPSPTQMSLHTEESATVLLSEPMVPFPLDASSSQKEETLSLPTDPTNSVATLPEHPGFLETRSLWNLAANDNFRVLSGHSASIRAIAFNSDGTVLVSGSADRTIMLWSLNTGQLIQKLSGHKSAVTALAFSLDGTTLASGSTDKTIMLWRLDTHEATPIQTLTGHSRGVNAISFSPNRQVLASGSEDKSLKLWNLSGEEIQTLTGHKMAITALTFSSDGQILASSSADRVIRFWNLVTQVEISTLSSLRSISTALLFSPDDSTLATGCDDKSIRLWNWRANQEIRTVPGQPWQSNAIAISSDGQVFASGCEDNTIRIWSL